MTEVNFPKPFKTTPKPLVMLNMCSSIDILEKFQTAENESLKIRQNSDKKTSVFMDLIHHLYEILWDTKPYNVLESPSGEMLSKF